MSYSELVPNPIGGREMGKATLIAIVSAAAALLVWQKDSCATEEYHEQRTKVATNDPKKCAFVSDMASVETVARSLSDNNAKLDELAESLLRTHVRISEYSMNDRCSRQLDYRLLSFMLASSERAIADSESEIDEILMCIDWRIGELMNILSDPRITLSIGTQARKQQSRLESVKTMVLLDRGSDLAVDDKSRNGIRRRIERAITSIRAEYQICNFSNTGGL